VIVAVYLATLADHAAVIARWGLLPAEPWRAVGLTFLSSALLHADVWHLVGNLYFLLVFGDDVEEVLGRPRYALLLLCAALAGGAAHVAFDPRADVPCIGASAAISGVLVAYASWFPRARLALLFFFFVSFRWLRCQAWFALVLWIVLQLVGAVMQAGGLSAVSAVAHLGGAGVGLLAWLAARGGRVDARRGAGAPRAA
jgi:membrane associated rhomboid family serine protease